MADSAHGDHLQGDVRRVCSRCGNVLTGGGVAAKHGEARKRVTVIFTDIVGSTALTEELEPEVLRLVGLRFHQTAREVLKGYGASIQSPSSW